MPRKYLSARRFPPPFPIPSCPTHSLKLFSWLQPTELQMIRKWLNPSDVFNIKYSLFFIRKKTFWNLPQKLREDHYLTGVCAPLKNRTSASKSPLQYFIQNGRQSIPAANLREKLVSGQPVWQRRSVVYLSF